MSENTISKSINKLDDNEKLSGSAAYVNDLRMDGMLYAKTLRSPVSHGIIKHIDYPVMPDGYHIVDASDVPGKNIVKIIFDDQPVFAEKELTYLGEPIALIVGPDREVLVDLINKTDIEVERLTPVFEWTNSVIHYHFDKGHGESVFEDADRIIEYDYETHYQEQAYLEPQGFIGYDDDGKITLEGSLQCPYYVKNAVVQALDADDDKVRIIQATVGGAFGGKEDFPSLIGCQLAVAARKIKKPIKMIYDRPEDMANTPKRHPSKTHFRAAIDDDDQIIGFKVHVGIDAGANIGLSGVVLSRALIAVSGVYTIDHLDVNGDVYRTNTVPNGAFRGFGAPQMFFAVEMFMGHIAKELGTDPLDFRMRYLAEQNDRTSTNGVYRDPIILPGLIEKAMEMSDYKKKRKLYAKKDLLKGIGMSFFLHGCGFTGSGEAKTIKAQVKLKKTKDGHVHILVASVDMGQGVKTTFPKLIADILEIPIDQVSFDFPDTDKVPDSGPTVASRTMMIVGGLLARAAKELKQNWSDGDEQIVTERYRPPEYIEWDDETFKGDAYPAYSWGVQISEVAVDPNTFEVTLEGLWGAYDMGRAIDERIVTGQVEGGFLQGVAYGYMEAMDHDEGKIAQSNLTDYMIPTFEDICPIKTAIIDNPYQLGPYGAKGVGELPLIGGAPAVAKAIEQAIKKRVHKIPVTPEYIMELMDNAKN